MDDKKYKSWIKKNYPKLSKKEIKKYDNKLTYKYNFERCKKEGDKNNFYIYFNEHNINYNKYKKLSLFELSKKLSDEQKELGNDYPKQRGFFFYDIWLRYIANLYLDREILYYSSLMTMESYLEMKLTNYFNKQLDILIPNKLLHKNFNEKSFKKQGKFYIMNEFITKANGKEKLLENVKKHWYNIYHSFLIKTIKEYIKDYSNITFRIEKLKKHDYYVIEIVGGEEAAKNIVINNYLNDFHKLQESEQIVKNVLKELKSIIKNKLLEIIKIENLKLKEQNEN